MRYLDPHQFVELMRPRLLSAARIARAKQLSLTAILKPSDPSPKEENRELRVGVISQVDIEIQESLLTFIHDTWPFVSILAEEDTPTKSRFAKAQEYCILLDPIDGTRNYLALGSRFCHTVSLMRASEMLATLVYSHSHNTLFAAIAHEGARGYLRGRRSRAIRLLARAGRTFLHHVSRTPESVVAGLSSLGYEVKPSSQNASDILDMFDGNIRGFVSVRPIAYDVWSPAMIVQEAGGVLCDWAGRPPVFCGQERLPNLLIALSEEDAALVIPLLARYAAADPA